MKSYQFKYFDSRWRRQCFQYDERIGWWHISNLEARLGLGQTFHRFKTNADGLRSDREYPKRKPRRTFRLIALGDSYTAGDGVSNGKRFTDILERKFERVEVMNFGLNGSGTDQQLIIFETLANQWEADALMWFFCVENIARNKYKYFPSFNMNEQLEVLRPKPYFELVNRGLVLHNSPVPLEMRSFAEVSNEDYGFPYLAEYPDDAYAIYRKPDSEHWRLMSALIERLLKQVVGKPVLLVPLPMDVHIEGSCQAHYLERFRELEDLSANVHVVDVLPALKYAATTQGQKLHFPNDPHYSDFAHGVVADCLEYSLTTLRRSFPFSGE